jgi:hypothetical protein
MAVRGSSVALAVDGGQSLEDDELPLSELLDDDELDELSELDE